MVLPTHHSSSHQASSKRSREGSSSVSREAKRPRDDTASRRQVKAVSPKDKLSASTSFASPPPVHSVAPRVKAEPVVVRRRSKPSKTEFKCDTVNTTLLTFVALFYQNTNSRACSLAPLAAMLTVDEPHKMTMFAPAMCNRSSKTRVVMTSLVI